LARLKHSKKTSRVPVVTALGVCIAALYFAQEVLIPLAVAVLLSFLLAPLVKLLERRRLARIPAVMLVVAVAFTLIGALGWVVGSQVVRLAEDMPRYQGEIVRKVRSLSDSGTGFGARFRNLGKEIENAAAGPTTVARSSQAGVQSGVEADAAEQPRNTKGDVTPLPPPGTSPSNPLFTVGLPPPTSPVKTLGTYLGLALSPLGTAALVVVFVVFMLVEREDLRDRMIRLVSRGRYTLTTRALDDAAKRISRYMLAQAIVNGTYGVTVAVGLWLIGLVFGHGSTFPNLALWGLLCALLRFIPYIGPWIAAAFPIAISLAVYPGFGVFVATLALLVVIEVVSNNVMEPWLYGASTGLSTVALLVAAVFWTWLWGPIGLLMSTPLTVCLVVLGKHVPALQFLDVLLGDQPALPPPVGFYQRLLAGDRREALAVVATVAGEKGLEQVPDEVYIPAVRLTRRDRAGGELKPDDEAMIYDGIFHVAEELDKELATGASNGGSAVREVGADIARGATVLGCTSHHVSEELVLAQLARMMRPLGHTFEPTTTRTLPSDVEKRIGRARPALVFIAVVPPGGTTQARYLCRRLSKLFPDLPIVVGYFGRPRNFDRLLVRFRSAGASYVATSLLQSLGQITAMLPPPPERATGSPAVEDAVGAEDAPTAASV
jgi:predicted PurR-regulated permease PerM